MFKLSPSFTLARSLLSNLVLDSKPILYITMSNNVGVLTAGPEQIEATWKAFTPKVIDTMLKAFTPEQIADAQWRIEHSEWTSIFNVQVSL